MKMATTKDCLAGTAFIIISLIIAAAGLAVVFSLPSSPALASPDKGRDGSQFALSEDTQFAIVRIWSVMYDDEKYGHLFTKDRSMADAVFAYLIARDNELTIKNDRYRRSAIYDRPGPLPEDGIVPGGQ